jgi:acyl carrier protein
MRFASVTMSDDTPTTERVVHVVQGTLMQHYISPSVRPDDDLGALGLSSMALADLALSVEAEFGLMIPDSEMVIANFRSVSAISKLVSALVKANLLDSSAED